MSASNTPHPRSQDPTEGHDCAEHAALSRRRLIGRGGAMAAATLLLPGLLRRARAAAPATGDHFVVVFLRGGADGMNMCVPYAEDAYHAARPNLAVGRPDDAGAVLQAMDLDGFFGLHPAMAPLMPLYQDGDLAFVHAVGSTDDTRSHFSAMNLMQRGLEEFGDGSGWLARHLLSSSSPADSVLRSVTTSALVPAFLTGARSTAVRDLARSGLAADSERAAQLRPLLEVLYRDVEDGLVQESTDAFAAIDALAGIGGEGGGGGGAYARGELGRSMATVARLLKEGVGTEVACIDVHGWDTHAAQGLEEGIHPGLIAELSQNLAAFREDLGVEWERTTVVVLSEFGRRLAENGALGTDHGAGNALMLLGGPVRGGQVYADWPGLESGDLVGPGDLAITLDYRDVLAEILRKRLGNGRMDLVFPGHPVREPGFID